MANRIYIAIGLLAIVLLSAAFIVPWLVDWNSYKPRMEEMTAEALGIDVAIEGDMAFTLLPQPRMRIEGVRLGPVTHPLGEAQLVEADFSLMDFLRDRFTVTQLRMVAPHINLTIDEEGHLETPITLAESTNASNVSIAQARFEDAIVTVTDMRNGKSRALTAFSGDMRMTGLRGPFALQGTGQFEGQEYSGRFSTSALNDAGHMTLAAFMRPVTGNYSVTLDGLLRTGGSPSFEGQGVYRRLSQSETDVTGDLVLTSPVVATTSEVLLNGFTLLPNEDQAATRMTGTASVSLGERPQFNAVISGGVVTLLPRVITEDNTVQPFELVRLLREMPQPILPPLPGRVGVDINELGLRGVALRDVRLDAVTNGELWRIEEFSGRLAGDTTVNLVGTLGRQAGWAAFDGTLDINARRLDALSLLWRRTVDGNPLFNMPGQLTGAIRMTNDGLRLNDGLFVLDGTSHSVSGLMRFGDQPVLEVDAKLAQLSPGQSAALLALLPPVDPAGAFGLSFPVGRLDLQAAGGRVVGQDFSDISLAMSWGADGIAVEGARISDFGGLVFEGSGQLAGTLADPVIAGSGQLAVARNASALSTLMAGSNNPIRVLVEGSLPAEVYVRLDGPDGDGGQALSVEGRAGEADIWLAADIADGVSKLGQGRLALTLEAQSDSGSDLTRQLGVAPVIAGEDGAILNLSLNGNPAASLETELTLEGGGERLDFSGTLITADLSSLRGQGQTSFLFADTSALAELAGVSGVWFPGIEGQAEIGFIGGSTVTIGNLSGYASERSFSGDLAYARQSNSALLTGNLHFDALDLNTLASMLGGPASRLRADIGEWPDGPLDIGQSARATRGRISIDAPALMNGDAVLLEALAFDYAWDAEDVRFRGLMGEIGGGTLKVEAALCCASVLTEKSLNGRFSLNGVNIDALLRGAGAETLGGVVTLGGQFQANGGSYRELISSLTGAGSIAVSDLTIERTSPDVFAEAAGLENITSLEPEALEEIVVSALDAGSFEASEAAGLYSLVGGTARATNLAIEGEGARLIGGGSLRLVDLYMDSNWTLALTRPVGGNELITETTGRVGIGVRGPLRAPERTLDLTQMVDAIQMRAYEIELNELERLRAEQEARQRAQAEEQARRIEEESRRQAEELLRQQELEAERLAEEERQRLLDEMRRDFEERIQSETPEPAPVPVMPADQTPSIQQIPPGALQLDLVAPR